MTRPRIIVAGLLALAFGAVAAVVVRSHPSYTLHTRFLNAGQLVSGGVVEIAGRKVGSIRALRLAPDGLADVELAVDDEHYIPLTDGTQARIRAVGQAGVANRYVELSPGPVGARRLHSGATLQERSTRGIVDLDEFFASLDASARAGIRRFIGRSSEVFAGSGARDFNTMLARLDPALAAVSGMTHDLSYDDRALAELLRSGAVATQALASRRDALEAVVAHSATAFGAIAAERRAVADVLTRAPAVLRQGAATLQATAATVDAMRPTLRAVPPAAGPLRAVLSRLDRTLALSRPTVAQLRRRLPDLNRSLAGFVPLGDPAVAGLDALAQASRASEPIMRGLRIYGADFVLGVTNGLAGIITSNYNADGHYARLNFVENPQTLFAGGLSSFLNGSALVPGVLQTRTGITSLCPGGNEPPAPDGSNPWVPDPSLCDPASSISSSVNEP